MEIATALSTGFVSLPIITSAAGVVFVILLVAFIYKFSIQEKSFEDAIEEQKRRKLEEEQQQKLKKGKKEKVFKRSWANKKKDKAERDTTPDISPVEEKRDIPQIEIIEPKESKPVKQKNKKSAPASSQTSNSLEKSDNTTVSEKLVQDKKKESPVSDKKKESPVIEKKESSVAEKKKEIPVQEKKKDSSVQEKKKEISVEKKKEVLQSEKEVEKLKAVDKNDVLKSKENVSAVPASTSNKKKKKEQPEKSKFIDYYSKNVSLVKIMVSLSNCEALCKVLTNCYTIF